MSTVVPKRSVGAPIKRTVTGSSGSNPNSRANSSSNMSAMLGGGRTGSSGSSSGRPMLTNVSNQPNSSVGRKQPVGPTGTLVRKASGGKVNNRTPTPPSKDGGDFIDSEDDGSFEEEATLDDEEAAQRKQRTEMLIAKLDAAALQDGESSATFDDGTGTGSILTDDGFLRLSVPNLQQHTGFDDLAIVSSTEVKVDATKETISVLGEWMPSIESLRLSFSVIPNLRDLGTKFSRLQVLFLNNCGIEECSGLQFHFHQLRELYMAFNKIRTLDSLIGLDNLEMLDVEANFIEDFDLGLGMIGSLESLSLLTLSGNPVVPAYTNPKAKVARRYRQKVVRLCRNLTMLDDTEVTDLDYEGEDEAGGDQSNEEDQGNDLTMPDDLKELALELAAVNESVKANAGIGVEKLVEEQHRPLYSRGSMSSSGQRGSAIGMPKGLTGQGLGEVTVARSLRDYEGPNSAPTLPSPDKVHASSVTRQSSSGGAANPTSSLTTSGSGAFSGSVTRNLRMTKRTVNSGGSSSGPNKAAPATMTDLSGGGVLSGAGSNCSFSTSQTPTPPDGSRLADTPKRKVASSEIYDPEQEEEEEMNRLLLADMERGDQLGVLLQSGERPDLSVKTAKELALERDTENGEDEFADERGTFDRLRKLYGYGADGTKPEGSEETEVQPLAAVGVESHLSTKDVVSAVRNQKLKDVAGVEKSIYQDAMGGVGTQGGSVMGERTTPPPAPAGGSGPSATNDFESLDLNAIGGDEDGVL